MSLTSTVVHSVHTYTFPEMGIQCCLNSIVKNTKRIVTTYTLGVVTSHIVIYTLGGCTYTCSIYIGHVPVLRVSITYNNTHTTFHIGLCSGYTFPVITFYLENTITNTTHNAYCVSTRRTTCECYNVIRNITEYCNASTYQTS